MAEVALEPQAGVPDQGPDRVAGRSPWALAWRRLRRNRLALASLLLFVVIVVMSFGAPFYANHIAHTDPFVNNVNGTTIVDGKKVPLMEQGGGAYITGRKATYVDLSLFQIVAGLRYAFPRRMKAFERQIPRLVALHDRVATRPNIAAYLASERRIPFNEEGIFRHYKALDD